MVIGCLYGVQMNKIMMKRQYREVLGWCQVKGLFHTPSIPFKTKGVGITCHYQKDIYVSLTFVYFRCWDGALSANFY